MKYGNSLYAAAKSVSIAALLALLAPSACSSSESAPLYLGSVSSATGVLRIDVKSAGGALTRGANVFEVRVTAVQGGQPLDGLGVSLVPWMPAMGHGTPVTSVIRPQGSGRYLVENVTFFMPGHWLLRMSFAAPAQGAKPPVSDSAMAEVDVP